MESLGHPPPPIVLQPNHPEFWKVGAVYVYAHPVTLRVRKVRVVSNDGKRVALRQVNS